MSSTSDSESDLNPSLSEYPNRDRNARALSSKQESKLVDFLDQRFLELTRNYKKRSEPTTLLPTLRTYLESARQILSIILQIPPIDPSTSLRTAFLLHLTNDVLSSIPGYPPHPQSLPELLDWLDDLDQAWVSVLQAQVWDPVAGTGIDLIIDAKDAAAGVRSSPVTQTERTRLKSLLLGGAANLEEWLGGLTDTVAGDGDGDGEEEDVESMLGRLGVQDGFDELFSRTLDEIGGLGGLVVDPVGLVGRCK